MKLAGLWSRSVLVWRECGGAGRSEHGLGPTLLFPPNLSPLPVFVHTHSLKLQHKTNLAPFYFFLFYNSVSLTHFIVFVRLTYPVNLAYSHPIRSLSGGE